MENERHTFDRYSRDGTLCGPQPAASPNVQQCSAWRGQNTDAPQKQAMPASSMGRATTCLPMDTVSGNDGTLKPNPKLHVPDRACTSTPRCRLVARMGHVWVPHENRQAMVEDKNLGGSCPGTTLIGALARGDRAFCCQSCGECTDKPGILGAVGRLH